MITRLIGIREFRQQLTTLHKEAREKGIRYIVLNRNEPIFRVEPLQKEDVILEELTKDIEEARTDIQEGRVYSLEEVAVELGI